MDSIDTKMVTSAAKLLSGGYTIADVLATIDIYYACPCDRDAYPFKPFARWAQWDFTKWLNRARQHTVHRAAVSYAKQSGDVAIRQPTGFDGPQSTDIDTRRREVNSVRTKRAIA